ncbi:MAG: BLUF domain-containing protein [Parasphingorhabdus sp.]|uniref:BLUF domain-containing protein n=1 Tax=Parasphingorhabdus sp. TaxID=2709688 RepID=UPI0032657D22
MKNGENVRQLVLFGKRPLLLVNSDFTESSISGHFSSSVLRKNDHLMGGILLSNGQGFLQALEGPTEIVEIVSSRVKARMKLFDVYSLSDRILPVREFGSWCLTISGRNSLAQTKSLESLLAGVSDPLISRAFLDFSAGLEVDMAIDHDEAELLNLHG